MKGKKVLNRAAPVARRLRPGKPMLVGALLSVVSMAAMAASDYSSLTGLTNIICTISNLISGPYLYGIGIVLITIGGVAVAELGKQHRQDLLGGAGGLGIASVAVPIMRDHFHMAVAC